jgi:hypothetical protein
MSNMDEGKEVPPQTEGDAEKGAGGTSSTQPEYPPLKVSIPIVLCIYMVVCEYPSKLTSGIERQHEGWHEEDHKGFGSRQCRPFPCHAPVYDHFPRQS